MATPTYTSIASITLGSSVSSVTFSSIPQGYRDLVLVSSGQAAGFTDVRLNFNNDTSAIYSQMRMRGNGVSVSHNARTETFFRSGGVQDFNNTDEGTVMDQILDYSATDKHKTILRRVSNTGSIGSMAIAGRWADTSAITEIDISGTQLFSVGCTFSLYGIEA